MHFLKTSAQNDKDCQPIDIQLNNLFGETDFWPSSNL